MTDLLRFDARNPMAIRAAHDHAADLIKGITAETRNALKLLISKSVSAGVPPEKIAHQVRDVIGLNARQQAAYQNYVNELESSGALTSGTVGTLGAKYIEKLKRARAAMIARTEVMAATNAGRLEAMQQQRDKGWIGKDATKEWFIAPGGAKASKGGTVCPVCRGLAGEVQLLDEPFSSGDMTPPAHPHCRCSMKFHPGTIVDVPEDLLDTTRAEQMAEVARRDRLQYLFPFRPSQRTLERAVELLGEVEARGVRVDLPGDEMIKKVGGNIALARITTTLEDYAAALARVKDIPPGSRLAWFAEQGGANANAGYIGEWKVNYNLWAPTLNSPDMLMANTEFQYGRGFWSAGILGDTGLHELGHVWHAYNDTRLKWGMFYDDGDPNPWKWTWLPVSGKGGELTAAGRAVAALGEYKAQQIAGSVSQAAQLSALEFVAETYLGLAAGKTYSSEVMALYRQMGGKVP